MTQFRLDVNRSNGEVRLWMRGDCGNCLIPIIGWDNIEGMKEFAAMLMGWYVQNKADKRQLNEVSDNLLRQALGDGESI